MDIRWLTGGCVELRTGAASVVVDPPYDRSPGVADALARADVVAVSRRAMRTADDTRTDWIDGPGEYEKAGVFVIGVRTLPARLGPVDEAELNTAYVLTADGISVCHLGGADHAPSEPERDALGRVDVLLVRFGAAGRLSPTAAAELVGQIEPRIVVPLHEAQPVDGPPPAEREALAQFLAAMGASDVVGQDVVRVEGDRLDDDTIVVLLQPVAR